MIKYIDLNIGDAEIDHASCFGGKCPLTKVAGENLLDSVKQKKDHAYLHVIAMGAGDFYSQNKNGDFFYEKDLRDYHNTFETAGVFIQHFNKDPSKTIGKVLKSMYNEDMHRVELVIEISKKKSPEQYERIKNGERISVSMGVKVPSEHCSYCGKVTKGSLANRCDHLKYKMGDTMENGQVAYAINDTPMNFFDISIVAKPADFQGHSLFQKVASMNTEEEYKEKIATLVKHMDAISAMPEIDDDELDDFKETFSPNLRLKIIRSRGIVLNPSEALFLGSTMGKEELPECRRHCNGEGFLRAMMEKVKRSGGCNLRKEAAIGEIITSPLLEKLVTRTMLIKEAVATRRDVDFYGNKRMARRARDTGGKALRKSNYSQYKVQMMNGETVGIPSNIMTAGQSLNPIRMILGGSKVPAYYTDLVDDGYAEHIIGVLSSGDEKIVYLPKAESRR